jgi:hypothetical protein
LARRNVNLLISVRRDLSGALMLVSGDEPMRILAILALVLSLAGCNGDRIKQGMNSPHKLI